jgi:ATP-dependent DNA helicase RecG
MRVDITNTSAQYIKGVGPDRLKLLKRLGISTIKDSLRYFPARYEDRSNIKPISQLKPDIFQTIKGKVVSSSIFRTRSAMTIFQLVVSDGTARLYCLWFRQPYMKKYFKENDIIILYGKIQKTTKLQVIHPEYEIIRGEAGQEDTVHTGRIVPIYPLASGINQRNLRRIIKNSIEQYASYAGEILPVRIQARHKLLDMCSAIKNIHFPSNESQRERARRRIVFDEFFLLQLILAIKRYRLKNMLNGKAHMVEQRKEEEFFNALPFKLTDAQKRVIEDIKVDMRNPRPMHRLIQGEVGSGKTLISAYGFFLTVTNNHQGAIMVPTEILAKQHYLAFCGLFAPLGITIALLINGMKKKEKEKVLQSIASGSVDIVVGTHTLIQKKIEFRDLGLLVIDEQHKFGVEQRGALKIKAKNYDMLIMTATPIPRTMAMTLYGDMDISIVDELPQGKRDVKTMWVDSSRINEVYDFVKVQLKEKKQAYIIYPVIDESSALKSEGAAKMYKKLQNNIFRDFKVGLIHGRLDDNEKHDIMKNFKKRKIDLLVATTIVEVGIDISNASVMVIENAERFGLSQLHQLRGRIGRGKGPSYCLLVSDARTEEARQRLEAISNTEDGFKIAQKDLDIRGPGELFGKRQHGLPELALGNLLSDVDILEEARKEAFSLVEEDPKLCHPSYAELRRELNENFKDKFHFGLIG